MSNNRGLILQFFRQNP